jgi:hypothetical protein
LRISEFPISFFQGLLANSFLIGWVNGIKNEVLGTISQGSNPLWLNKNGKNAEIFKLISNVKNNSSNIIQKKSINFFSKSGIPWLEMTVEGGSKLKLTCYVHVDARFTPSSIQFMKNNLLLEAR